MSCRSLSTKSLVWISERPGAQFLAPGYDTCLRRRRLAERGRRR